MVRPPIGIKVEITIIKAEPSLWPKLNFPREKKPSAEQVQEQLEEESKGSIGGFGLGRHTDYESHRLRK